MPTVFNTNPFVPSEVEGHGAGSLDFARDKLFKTSKIWAAGVNVAMTPLG